MITILLGNVGLTQKPVKSVACPILPNTTMINVYVIVLLSLSPVLPSDLPPYLLGLRIPMIAQRLVSRRVVQANSFAVFTKPYLTMLTTWIQNSWPTLRILLSPLMTWMNQLRPLILLMTWVIPQMMSFWMTLLPMHWQPLDWTSF
jgi:hypothetical protein